MKEEEEATTKALRLNYVRFVVPLRFNLIYNKKNINMVHVLF